MIQKLIALYLIIINAAGFILMLRDKRAAQKSAWRIPEAVLMNTALFGGCFGIYWGMMLFRHKTKHPKFYLGIPALLALHIVILFFAIKITGV